MRKFFHLCIAFLVCVSTLMGQDQINIQCQQELDSNTAFMQGFLHGGALTLDSTKVAQLKPQFWRIGAYWLVGSGYEETAKFQSKITVNVNDLYMIANGISSQLQSQPWTDNWQNWDALLTTLASNSIQNAQVVDYWDLWGEPDNFWTGSYAQWIEMYRRSDSILTSILSNPKIVGPEFGFGNCDFQIMPILNFLDDLASVGGSVQGVSWHEFCQPENVPQHVQTVRDSLASRPWLGNLDILIPEYAGPGNHTIPGWNVGWLYYFEKAQVNWVSHSCWDETDGNISWSNCEKGLNGLFLSDNSTPQPNYWVHRAYASLDSIRVECNTNVTNTIALASKNDILQEMKILVGRYDNPVLGSHNAPSNVSIHVKDFPYCSNCTLPFVIQRIPSNDVAHSIALPAPILTLNGWVTFVGDSATIVLNNFVDGDAYVLYIQPTAILSNSDSIIMDFHHFVISPNPVQENLTITSFSETDQFFTVTNAQGVIVLSNLRSGNVDVSALATGLYFVRPDANPLASRKFLKL